MGKLFSAIRERLRFKRWGKWLVVGGVGFVVLSVVSVEATSQASFCGTCHIMEPYYDSWKKSSHKDVQCVECHIPPGAKSFVAAKLNGLGQVVDDVLNRTSNKPSASISVLSCTRSGCHSTETLKAKKIDNGKFKFDHSKHLERKHLGVEISCGTCHSHVKGDDHFRVNTDVCITCHLVGAGTTAAATFAGEASRVITLSLRSNAKPTESSGAGAGDGAEKIPPAHCTACHDAPSQEIEFQGLKFDHAQFLSFGATCESCHKGVTAAPPTIDDGRCLECHTFGVERALESKEMHRVHTLGEHKIECSSCHGSIRHGLKVPPASSETFDCSKCHSDQHATQRSTYFNPGSAAHPTLGAGTDSKSPMFLAHVDCTGCHTKKRALSSRPESGATVLAADPASCDACHKPGYGAQMVPLWQKATRSLYDQVSADLEQARGSGVSPATLTEVEALLRTIKSDGSWGVHNPRFAQQTLEHARELLRGGGAASGGAKETKP